MWLESLVMRCASSIHISIAIAKGDVITYSVPVTCSDMGNNTLVRKKILSMGHLSRICKKGTILKLFHTYCRCI